MDSTATKHREAADGPLRIRVSRDQDRDVIALRGELDMANARLVRREFDSALSNRRGTPIVVDMRELEFIDSAGIAVLVIAINRGIDRLRFVPSDSPAVRRLLTITGIARWMMPAAAGIASPTGRGDPDTARRGRPSESAVLKALRRTADYRRQREARLHCRSSNSEARLGS